VPQVLAAGLLAGATIAALTVLVEHSRIAFGAYALYGNGSLIVPGLLAPFALYPGWTWALRRGGRALELALYVTGVYFGIGVISVLEVIFFPQGPDLTLFDALPGFLFTGAIFVLPAAFLAAAALWTTRRSPATARGAAILVALVTVAAALGYVYGVGLGILAGSAVALAERRPERTLLIGAALAVFVLVVGNLPFVLLLFVPAPS
jgi:hypothetical protein